MRDSKDSRFYRLVRARTGTRKRKVLSQPSLLSLLSLLLVCHLHDK